jgi:hypothetical protein
LCTKSNEKVECISDCNGSGKKCARLVERTRKNAVISIGKVLDFIDCLVLSLQTRIITEHWKAIKNENFDEI